MKLLRSVLILLLAVGVGVAEANAQAVQLDLTDYNDNGRIDVYRNGGTQRVYASPYQGHFVYSGGVTSATFDFFCVDFNNNADLSAYEVNQASLGDSDAILATTRFGQEYGAGATLLGLSDSYSVEQKYQQAAWLVSKYYSEPSGSWHALQVAIWKVFAVDPMAAIARNTSLENDALAWLGRAEQNYGEMTYGQFVVVTGADVTGMSGGPQEYIMITPEPETYALMAGGLLLLAIAYRRRRRDQESPLFAGGMDGLA